MNYVAVRPYTLRPIPGAVSTTSKNWTSLGHLWNGVSIACGFDDFDGLDILDAAGRREVGYGQTCGDCDEALRGSQNGH